MTELKGLSFLLTIVDRGIAKGIVKTLKEIDCTYNQITYGKGTAPEEIYDYLGFGKTEKEVIISVCDSARRDEIFNVLKTRYHFDEPGKGICISIPVDSVAGARCLKQIVNNEDLKEAV